MSIFADRPRRKGTPIMQMDQDKPELETTWGRTIRVWCLFMWRGAIGAFALNIPIVIVLSLSIRNLGLPQPVAMAILNFTPLIIGLPWSIVVMRMALRKRYDGFRVVLVAHNGGRA
jgi:hypothetical protein